MARTNKSGLDWDDPESVKSYKRMKIREKRQNPEYREAELAVSRKNRPIRRDKIKQKAIEYTGSLQCHGKNCLHIKHNEPLDLFSIDFHHVITENKTKEFATLFSGYKWPRIKKEIDNCAAIPLCRICHQKLEYGK